MLRPIAGGGNVPMVLASITEETSEIAVASPAERRRARLEAELQRFLTILVDKLHPERIILFGSLANGQIHEWSDLDLVVVAETELPFLERLEQIFLRLEPHVGLDVLVYTPEEVQRLRQ